MAIPPQQPINGPNINIRPHGYLRDTVLARIEDPIRRVDARLGRNGEKRLEPRLQQGLTVECTTRLGVAILKWPRSSGGQAVLRKA
jgi:hypothetical protein